MKLLCRAHCTGLLLATVEGFAPLENNFFAMKSEYLDFVIPIMSPVRINGNFYFFLQKFEEEKKDQRKNSFGLPNR